MMCLRPHLLMAELELIADILIPRPVLGTLYKVHNNSRLAFSGALVGDYEININTGK